MDDKNAGNSLDMSSVADLMDGRLLHTLVRLFLEQRSKGLEGMPWEKRPYFFILVVVVVVRIFCVTAHQSQTQERAMSSME